MKPSSLIDIIGLLRDDAVVEMVHQAANSEDTPWGTAAAKLHELEATLQNIFKTGEGKETR